MGEWRGAARAGIHEQRNGGGEATKGEWEAGAEEACGITLQLDCRTGRGAHNMRANEAHEGAWSLEEAVAHPARGRRFEVARFSCEERTGRRKR